MTENKNTDLHMMIGEPKVDICDNDGKLMTTPYPKDYNEFINLI